MWFHIWQAFKLTLFLSIPVFFYQIFIKVEFLSINANNAWYWILKSMFILSRMASSDYFPQYGTIETIE
jgi:O-antigen/teichoic acid export membrane protein